MIANGISGCLQLSPESDEDEQALRALSEACPAMRWECALKTRKAPCSQGLSWFVQVCGYRRAGFAELHSSTS